ncbi:MAG: helix-turn-helix domain-containing protein [Desulforegulaceae bacterium]|nr:helix-turn-helix domain-containing protein [Desulforegulaceae bacterium]
MVNSGLKYPFGSRIRKIREKKKLTLKTVASSAGVSESLISQIERDKVSPSIDTLFAIIDVLDIDLEYIFKDFKKKRMVNIVKAEEKNIRTIGDITYHQLSSISSTEGDKTRDIEAYLIEIPFDNEKGNSGYGHAGKEMGFILEGSGILEYGGVNYVLEEGDSVSFASDIPHKLKNSGTKILKAFWVTTPPRLFINND